MANYSSAFRVVILKIRFEFLEAAKSASYVLSR